MKIYLYGAGRNGKKIYNQLHTCENLGTVAGFVETSPKWEGTRFCGQPVYSLEKLLTLLDEKSLVILTPDVDISIKIAKNLKENNVQRYVYWNDIDSLGFESALSELSVSDSNGIANRSLIYENKILDYQVKFLLEHIEPSAIKPADGPDRQKQLDMVRLAADFQHAIAELNVSLILDGGNLLGYVRHNAQFIPWDDDLDLAVTENEFIRLYNFCKEALPFFEYDGIYDNNLIYAWYDKMVSQYPGQMIILCTPLLFRVYRDHNFIDILPIRGYAAGITYEQHSEFLDSYRKNMASCKTCREQRDLRDKVLSEDAIYEKTNGENWTFSPLTWEAYYNNSGIKQWFKYQDLFPLQRICFEKEQFWAPGNISNWLKVEFGNNYMSLPKDLGLHMH